MLNSVDDNSFSDLVSVYLNVFGHHLTILEAYSMLLILIF